MVDRKSKARVVDDPVRPFLKWVGGKHRVLPWLTKDLPSYRTYYEPLVGGGALFFALRPKRAVLSDTNAELVDCFTAVRDNVERVILHLERHRYTSEHYYQVRDLRPEDLDPYERAARTVYLNKTGFNGLYRVNREGRFNVPFGRHKNPTICDADNLRACSAALQGVVIRSAHFAQACRDARSGDLVYFDPPFVPLTPTANFTAYTSDGFGYADHYHLAGVFAEVAGRGCYAMLSNSDTKLARRLYADYAIQTVEVGRTVGCKDRGSARELIVRSFRAKGRARGKR